MTIRETLLQLDARAGAIEQWPASKKVHNSARAQRVLIAEAIEILDNSREITEKLTMPYEYPGYWGWKVTSHKARIVLDD